MTTEAGPATAQTQLEGQALVDRLREDELRSIHNDVSTGLRDQILKALNERGKAQELVRQGYTGRYPFELLQNANDAASERGGGRVVFAVTDDALVVADEGSGFGPDQIRAICGLGQSSKNPRKSMRIGGLVDNPVELTFDEIRALPRHEQITQQFCIQGWSGVAKWSGVSMATILDLVRPTPEARWVVFYSLGDGPDGGLFYDAHPIEQMRNPLATLAYDMNGDPLSYGHGAPLRLRNELQLGFKQVKWIAGIDFVAHFSEVGGGYGGYNQDHEFFGYRQSI